MGVGWDEYDVLGLGWKLGGDIEIILLLYQIIDFDLHIGQWS